MDALASTADAPEAALLTILMPLGVAALYQMLAITPGVLGLLTTLYLLHRQTVAVPEWRGRLAV